MLNREVALPLDDGKPFEIVCDAADREVWLAERMKGIGASEAPVVMGLSPWRTPLSLFAEKIGLEEPADENEAMYWGSKIEPLVRDRFAAETGRQVFPGGKLLRSKARPHMLATLDSEQAAYGKPGLGALEIKCTGLADNWSEGVPDYVSAQVQHQLYVTGHEWASVAVLFGGRSFKWDDVGRDEEFIGRLVEACDDFWRRVTENDPPTAQGSEVDKRILGRMYPQDDGSVLRLDGEFIDYDERLEALRVELKQIEHEKLAIENLIKQALGNATTGILPNGAIYNLKTINRKETIIPASSHRRLTRKEIR